MTDKLIEAPERAEWFSVAMNAAASLEDAANCLRDSEAKSAALGAAKHVREKCNALWSAHRSQQEAAQEPVAGREPVTFYPSDSHISTDWRDGWNAALKAVAAIKAEKGGA